MKYKIKCVRKSDGEVDYGKIFNDRLAALDYVKSQTAFNEYWTYTIVRLVSRREKLKRKLLADAARFQDIAQEEDRSTASECWYAGYARALRDVAGQL